MKKILLIALLFLSFRSNSQTVFGYWYGDANVKTNSSANNYLVELILMPEKNYIKGILNYYFKDTYRSLLVKGNYNAATRQLSLYDIPVVYHGSIANFEVSCTMNLQATLRVAQVGSELVGSFVSLPDYKYVCANIDFRLRLDASISNVDSVLKALSEYKENLQVWKPTAADTLAAVNILQRKVINYVIEREYTERENVVANEIEVASDSLKVDFYDNGEIDGDSISVFFNNKLTAFHQKLSTRPVHFDIVLDSLKKINELTMFAENLGSIPPNTALMLIYDGTNRYAIRLSSNLEKNATIRIKRKKDGIKVPK
ncbi:MAG: hypothetical protein H7Y01_12540 [Ferruginibacter sp.]|nr:hypothetical protein [Chitinophagaceae bacterium]